MKSAACIQAYRSLKAIVESNRTRLGRTVKKGISLAICLSLLTSNLAFAKEAIVADGKTQTTISQDGSVTNISTDTILNQNAFNSFSRFNVDSGHTVNLYVPSGAANLLNLVHSEQSFINGVLNSIRDGQIGGNVFFLNPHGLIVGSEGILNVGSLTAISPTTRFMEDFFDSSNNPSGLAVNQVLAGEVPLNESGLITVQGTINAIGDIRLSSGDVEHTGIITSGAVFTGTSPDFTDVVNIAGLASGSAMSMENGSIVITAHNDVLNSGIIASNGGDVNVQAGGRIEITDGALVDAQGTGGDGDISLTADRSDHVTIREANANTGIYIADAELKGKDISLTASADAQYELSGLSSVVLKNVDDEIGYTLDAEVALAQAAAASEILLGDGSVLRATGDIVLEAGAAATAKTDMKDVDAGKELSISFLYGQIESQATVDVQDGAQITASNLSIGAKNQAALDINVQSTSLEGESVETAIAVTKADVSALAQIGAGAQINITNDLSITALNTNEFATSAEAKARKDGLAGIAAVFFTANTKASAVSDANLGLKNLTIDALDNTIKNTTSASSEVGGEELYQKAGGYVAKGTKFIEDKFGEKAPELDEKSGNAGGLQAAGTIAMVAANQRSLAKIGDSAEVSVQNDVVVNAQTRNAGLQNKAVSNVEAQKDGDEPVSLSAAIAYGDYRRNAEAYLGSGSRVQAQRVGIGSQIVMPYIELKKHNIQWDKFTDLSTISDELAKLKDLAGNPFLTSYANATGTGGDVGVAGSLGYTNFDNNSSAYLGTGAQVTLLPGTNSPWETTLPSTSKIKWNAPLSIAASTDHTGVYAAGNFSFSLQGTGGEPGSASAGGAYNQVNHKSSTRAYVAAGAAVIQEGPELKDISITADTKELVIALGPTSGRGGSVGLNGMFSMTTIDSNTEASISNEAFIAAKALLLKAKEDVVSWALTGAVNMSESAGVGAAIAVNDITTNTRAFIGPNAEEDGGLDPGRVRAESLLVNALTEGRIEAISVAGATASSKDPGEQPSEGFLSKAKGKLTSALEKLVGKTEEPKEAANPKPPSEGPKTEPKFGLAISGSSSVNLGDLNTKAYVADGLIELTGGQRFLGIRAINNTQVLAASGAAALSRAKNPSSKFSAGIAGSIACNDLLNQTAAEMTSTDAIGAQGVAVQALAGGQQVAVALGLGANASADPDTAASAAGSVSVNTVTNRVTSTVQDSKLTGQEGLTDRHLNITAYDRTKVGTGGGSLIYGGKAGLGAAITYSEIDSTAGAYLSRTQISGLDLLQVHSLTASLIGAGGAMGGYTQGAESGTFGGAIVINKVNKSTEAVIDSAKITGGSIDVLARDVNAEDTLDSLIDGGEEQLADELDYAGGQVFTDDAALTGTSSIIAVAGVGQGSGSNVGVSFVWNEISNDFQALVKGSQISDGADVQVQALSNAMIVGLSIGASYASGRFSGAASVTANEIGSLESEGNSVSAEVIDSDIQAGSLSILAQDNSQIWSLAGQITTGAKASLGGAIAHNVINNSVQARLTGGTLTLAESLLLKASNDSTIRTLAVAGGGSKEFAFNGSVTSAHISNDTIAEIGSTEESDPETVVHAKNMDVEAVDNSKIEALSGAFTGSKTTAVGGATSVSTIGNKVIARIGQSRLTLGSSLVLKAQNDGIIHTLAAAAEGAQSAAVSGSLTESNIFNTTGAEMVNTHLVGAADGISIKAGDGSKIYALAGGAAGSTSAAIGGAVVVNTVTNTTRSFLQGSALEAAGKLSLEGQNNSVIHGVSVAVGGSDSAAVNGSIIGSVIANTTEALMENTDVATTTDGGETSSKNVNLKAEDASEIHALAGGVSGSGTAAVAGAATASTVTNTTRTKVNGGSIAGADALVLEALNTSTIKAASAAGSGSGTGAVSGSATVSVVNNSVLADIDGTEVNTTEQVGVAAKDQSKIQSLAGSASFSGTAAVGGAVAVNTITNTTQAGIRNATLGHIGTLQLEAVTDSDIQSASAAGEGAGTAAVGGSSTTSIIKNTTAAELVNTTVGDGADTADSVQVTAKDASSIQVLAGNVGLSGTAAVGGAVGTNIIANTTAARIAESQVNASDSTLVQADNQSAIEAVSVSGAGSGTAAVTGSVAASHIANTTEAEIVDSQIENDSNHVSVLAADDSQISSISGGAAASGTASVGAAVSANRIANTTTARVSAGTLAVEGLLVKGKTSSTIESLAVGLGGSGVVGVAGSTAINLIDSDTTSYIDSGADITAQNNVGVLAETNDVVTNRAGATGIGLGAVGVGASVTVNQISGSTKAYISGPETKVTALAQAEKLTVAEGGLQEDVDLGAGLDLDKYSRPELADLRKTEEVGGIAVVASGTHSVENVVANAGIGAYAGVAGTTNTSVITGTTEAYVDQAKVNSGQALHVQASDHAYSRDFIGSVGAGIAGVGMGIDTTVFSNSTRAYIKGANPVQAQGLVEINAQSTQGASSLATSGAGGIVGVAGTGTVGVFNGTTEAYLKSTPVAAGGLAINAQHDSRLFVAAGSAGIGGAAVGGAFTVAVDHSITKAYVADATVDTAGTIDVQADNDAEIRNHTASGSGGGGAGIAGSALVSIIGNTTQAYITNSRLGQGSSRVGGVSVQAWDRVLSENKAGAVGLGVAGAGVGAGAAVTLVDNTTSAYVEGSSIYTSDDLLVAALAERDLSTTAVSAGLGAGAGLGGTAVVTLVGRALSGDVAGELDKNGTGTLTELEAFANNDRLKTGEEEGNVDAGEEIDPPRYDPVNTDDEFLTGVFNAAWNTVEGEAEDATVTGGLTETELASMNTAGKASVTGSLHSADLQYQTSALVKDSSVTARGDVQITAAEKVKVDIDSGAVGAGLGLGIGGSVAVLDMAANVRAEVLGDSTITAEEGTIGIAAQTSSPDAAVSVNAYQGSAGIAALGAAVSTAQVTNNATARVGQGSVLHINNDSLANQGLVVLAHDGMAVNTKAYGAGVGLAAAGIVAANAQRAGSVTALVDDQTEVSLASGLLSIKSLREGKTSAYSLAGAGGVHAGNASVAQARETGLVQASIGEGVTITAPGGAVQLEALAKPQIAADSLGYGGAIFSAVGLSLAEAAADTKIKATIGTGGKIKADSLTVSALVQLAGISPTVRSYAEAIGGGALLGANAANSVAKSSLVITASLGSNLEIVHNVQVLASNTTKQEAKVSGIVGGLAAVGANLATAEANSRVTALVGDGAAGTVGGILAVNAVGSDDTYAEAASGSGGVVTGAAALAKTKNRSITLAELGTASRLLTAGRIALHARHTALFNGQSDSINASVVGASGAQTLHDVDADVAAKISEMARLETFDLKAGAENIVRKGWLSGSRFNVNAGSGGLLNGAAALSKSDIDVNTQVIIGAQSTINVVGDGGNPGRTDFTAINDIEARDKTRLDAGGAISAALAESRINVNKSNAQVNMGNGASIDAVGDVNFSSRTRADLETSANSKTYGLAGAAAGTSRSYIASDNSVVVGDAALIRAGGNINFYAGRDETGYFNTMRSIARTDLFNKTAVPISTDPTADAVITQNNWISTGQGSLIRSVRDVSLITTKGSAVADGHGVGKDLYRQLAEDIGNAFSGLVGGGQVSLDIQSGSSTEHAATSVQVDSRIDTGIHNKQRLIIDRDGNLADMTEGVNYYVTEEDVITNMFVRLESLAEMRALYANDAAAAAAYDSEISYIKQELLSLGYAEQHGASIVPVKNLKARYINVDDVEARGGNVHVEADSLTGTGHLSAPNDTSITITNNSMNFLRVNNLSIDPTGGHVYFNKAAVTSADDINERNQPGSPKAHLNIVAAGSSSAAPTVVVRNTYSAPGDDFVPPDIELMGGQVQSCL